MTTTYPGSTTDRAAQIRAALKAKGWTARDVSVRAKYYSLGSAIEIRVKNPDVPLTAVEAIAADHECIHRDEFTGEILGGGNRYVNASYTHDALMVLSARYADAVQRAVAQIDSPNVLIPVEGADGFLVGLDRPGRFTLWRDGHFVTDAYTVTDLAQYIGTLSHA